MIATAAGAAWWFVGPPPVWIDQIRGMSPQAYAFCRSLWHEIVAFSASHPLPQFGWSGWSMLGSLAVMLVMIFFLRGSRGRYNLLQKCLLVSVLLHVMFSFALSSVIVTQRVTQYVKQETGVDLSLSLPRSVEEALAVRHPRSSEGPQAAAPRDLAHTLTAVQQPHEPAAAPLDVPLDAAMSGRGSALAIAMPRLSSSVQAPAASMAPPTIGLSPITPPPEAATVNVPMLSAVRQEEAEPRVSSQGPQPLSRSGLSTPTLVPSRAAGPTLAVGAEKASDHLDSIVTPAPLPRPAVDVPMLVAGASGPAISPGPQIPSLPLSPLKVANPSPLSLLAMPEPGEGNDAELGRSVQNGGGSPGVRFAPIMSGPRALPGSFGDGADAVPAPPPVAINLPPPPVPDIPKIADTIVSPRAPLIPAPPPAPTTQPRQVVADTPFQRAPEQRKGRIAKLGGSPQSEEAVEHALRFLARQQEPDGRWTLVQDESLPGKRKPGPHDMAYTGLALLTFLAHDQSPLSPGPYQAVVRRGVNYLLSNQSEDGDLRGPPEFRGGASQQANMYDHAIAMLAISESALLSSDQRLRSSALAAAQFIIAAQDRDGGGWRYAPGQSGDTSVFGWEIMALHSAELLGFKVPADTRGLARRFINDVSTGPGNVDAGYQPGVDPTQTMTGEMLFARMLLGERFSDASVADATTFLAQYPPDASHPDLYCWYYASLCMLQMNSPAWSDWNTRTRDALIQLQTRGGFADGCWEVTAKGIDRSGFIFTTAIATLTLEVYYRYAPGLAEAPGP